MCAYTYMDVCVLVFDDKFVHVNIVCFFLLFFFSFFVYEMDAPRAHLKKGAQRPQDDYYYSILSFSQYHTHPGCVVHNAIRHGGGFRGGGVGGGLIPFLLCLLLDQRLSLLRQPFAHRCLGHWQPFTHRHFGYRQWPSRVGMIILLS